jgi:hypothetical protein
MKRSTFRHLGLALLATAAALSLSTCEDFFGTADLKAIIKEDVETATAESVNVTLAAVSDSMGVPSPYGVQTFKVGVEYSISTTVSSDYAFLGWTHTGASGDVSFSNSTSVSTRMTINNAVGGISIIPTYDQRPYVVSMRPYENELNVPITTPIKITFSEPVDLSTTLGNIAITRKLNGSSSDPDSIISKFGTPTLSGSVLTIPLLSGQSLGSLSEIYEVFVTIFRNIADVNGNIMSRNERPVRFFTSKTADTNSPVIAGDILVKTTSGTLISLPGHPTSSRSVKLDFEAADGESDVLYALVKDDLGNTLYNDSYARNIDISLPDIEELRTLSVTVTDPSSETG